jgi:hypothetical protein
MLSARRAPWAERLLQSAIEQWLCWQASNHVDYGQRGKKVAGLIARHGLGVDVEVFGELFLCQANCPTAVSDIATQTSGQRPTNGGLTMLCCTCKSRKSSCFYSLAAMISPNVFKLLSFNLQYVNI